MMMRLDKRILSAASIRKTALRFASPNAALALLLGAVSFGHAAPPEAAEPIEAMVAPLPLYPVYLTHTEFPVGGIITGQMPCQGGCSTVNLVFYDAESQILTGDFVEVSESVGINFFGWVADPALVPGQYFVFGDSDLYPTEFRVVEASDEPPAVEGNLSVNVGITGELVHCEEASSTRFDSGFYENFVTRAVLQLTITGNNASQYSYTVLVTGQDSTVTLNSQGGGINLEGEPSEVCFEVSAQSILDQTEISVGVECLSTADLGLGTAPGLSTNFEYSLKGCTVPPSGYLEEWCEFFASAFQAESCLDFDVLERESCFAARRSCSGGDNPPSGTEEAEDEEELLMSGTGGASVGGTGVSGGSESGDGDGDVSGGDGDGDGNVNGGDGDGNVNGGDGDGNMNGGDSDLADPSTDIEDGSVPNDEGGCSFVPSANPGPGGLSWALLGLGALALSRRRSPSLIEKRSAAQGDTHA